MTTGAERNIGSAGRAAFDCDVLIVGGGPAGSAAAAWLARSGHRVILFERDQFPRFHIGESLLASVNDVLGAIGADDLVRQAGFPAEVGRDVHVGRRPHRALRRLRGRARRARAADLAGAARRIRRAAAAPRGASGADVRERHRVLDVAFDEDGVTASVQSAEGPALRLGEGEPEPRAVRAQAIIDASGRGALLSRKFGLRIDEPRLANLAVFSHYSGVPRRQGRRAGDIRIVAREDLGWFWLIPISDELMSVGVVLPRAAARTLQALEPGALLERAIAETPAVARLLAGARRWPVRVEKDFSFWSRAYAGDRWVLAGDAGSFLDPVFSTGVAIALESGLEAAQAVEEGLKNGDLTVRQFGRFARRQRQRYVSFRRFVLGFYTPEFRDLFFAEEPPRRLFRSLVTVFAGYWRPSLATRIWVALFFLLVRLQRWVRFAPRLTSSGGETTSGSSRPSLR